ncbi:sugar phosphate isomerase/epimerase family protein [Mycoplasmatota bacterium zrk1]
MKIKNGIGISDANGFPFLSCSERFRLYKECGFTSVMIWWGEDDSLSREERVGLARNNNLNISNVHSDFYNMNSIWLDSVDGNYKFNKLLQEIEDCHKYNINTIVMHLTNGDTPPEISDIGLKRLEGIFELALKYGITIALENVRKPETLIFVLEKYSNSNVNFCYDCGHENVWSKDIDWLKLYGDRLSAIHLHNNYGETDDHLNLSQGLIELEGLANKLKETEYEGSLNIESIYKGVHNIEKLRVFLEELYEEGIKFSELLLEEK